MSMHDNQLDRLIDETARALTEAVPSPALRAHVRGRIRSAPPVRLPAWQIATAAAAVIITAVLAGRGLLMGSPEHTPIQAGTHAARALLLAGPAMPVSSSASAAIADARATRRRARAAAVPPITVTPLEIEPIAEPAAVSVELLEVPMPLRAERLEIDLLVFE